MQQPGTHCGILVDHAGERGGGVDGGVASGGERDVGGGEGGVLQGDLGVVLCEPYPP